MKVRRIQFIRKLKTMSERENVMIKQKVRVEWIERWDTNTKFFHSRLRWRLLNNEIKGLFVNGEWCVERDKVKTEVKKYFENRFQEQPKGVLSLDGVQFRNISAAENEFLCCKFKEDEILEAVKQCGGTKSPGSNGFNFFFIKTNWEIMGDDIYKAIHSFHEFGYIPKGCNTSFITLIPKKVNPGNFGDSRPISLVGTSIRSLPKF